MKTASHNIVGSRYFAWETEFFSQTLAVKDQEY